MASRGAKNLILLSRSGNVKDSSMELVGDLEGMGARVATPRCDVSDVESLKNALNECLSNGMPPVKGCFQGAMVLRVGEKKKIRSSAFGTKANVPN
jgi:KR domain-containing protein